MVVGCGPCGELRYPSYVETNGWRFPVGVVLWVDGRGRRWVGEGQGWERGRAGLVGGW